MINQVVFFKLTDARTGRDFRKIIDLFINYLKMKEDLVQARSDMSTHPVKAEYSYIVMVRFKDLKQYVQAFEGRCGRLINIQQFA
ncbi:MAG: hypothetical protein ACMUEM_06775 [Flavobacteriales bacterium AspAUS03]